MSRSSRWPVSCATICKQKNEPLTALLTGVDEGWEVCLLKFMIDLINASAPGNIGDFHERGML